MYEDVIKVCDSLCGLDLRDDQGVRRVSGPELRLFIHRITTFIHKITTFHNMQIPTFQHQIVNCQYKASSVYAPCMWQCGHGSPRRRRCAFKSFKISRTISRNQFKISRKPTENKLPNLNQKSHRLLTNDAATKSMSFEMPYWMSSLSFSDLRNSFKII